MNEKREVIAALQVLRDYCERHRCLKTFDVELDTEQYLERACRDEPDGRAEEDAPCDYEKCMFYHEKLQMCFLRDFTTPPEEWVMIDED